MDAYTRRARIYPALLAALPLSLFAVAFFPSVPGWWPKFAALISASGFPILLGQLGRSAGKRKEETLFETWGGPPTTVLLRHRSGRNPVLLHRYHENLSSLLGGAPFPTDQQEAANPQGSDALYETAARVLRERTRDRRRFPLVFAEVVNYGFRRNLWGLRPLGLVASVMSILAASITVLLIATDTVHMAITPFAFVLVADVLALLLWFAVVTTPWVEESAFAYAEQLLASSEQVAAD